MPLVSLGKRKPAGAPPPAAPRVAQAPAPSSPRLSPPLAAPLRLVVAGGDYGAPRYDRDRSPHSPSSARPFYTGQPPSRRHQGVDLAARAGEPVYAVGFGRVVARDPGHGRLVVVVVLDRGYPVDEVVYADLGSRAVSPGERVTPHTVVGTVATSFVHVALKRRGAFVNPHGILPFLDHPKRR